MNQELSKDDTKRELLPKKDGKKKKGEKVVEKEPVEVVDEKSTTKKSSISKKVDKEITNSTPIKRKDTL